MAQAQEQEMIGTGGEELATSLKERIKYMLDSLTEPDLRTLLTFLEYLDWKDMKQHQDNPFHAVIGTVPGAAMSSEEIDIELYGPMTVREEADAT